MMSQGSNLLPFRDVIISAHGSQLETEHGKFVTTFDKNTLLHTKFICCVANSYELQ